MQKVIMVLLIGEEKTSRLWFAVETNISALFFCGKALDFVLVH